MIKSPYIARSAMQLAGMRTPDPKRDESRDDGREPAPGRKPLERLLRFLHLA